MERAAQHPARRHSNPRRAPQRWWRTVLAGALALCAACSGRAPGKAAGAVALAAEPRGRAAAEGAPVAAAPSGTEAADDTRMARGSEVTHGAGVAAGADATFGAFVWHSPGTSSADAERVARRIGGRVRTPAQAEEQPNEPSLPWLLFNAAGRAPLHRERDAEYLARWRRWYDSRDAHELDRRPCLADPQVRRQLEATLRDNAARARARAPGAWFALALGDEVALTPDAAPEDGCLCMHCEGAWRAWLESRPDLDERTRREWAPASAWSTDRVRRACGDGNSQALGPWLARRAFEADLLEDVLTRLEHTARGAAPGVPIGLLGVPATSPFGTPRVETLARRLDFLEAYPQVDARELLAAQRAPNCRVWQTVFADGRPPARLAADVLEHWWRGGTDVVLWEDGALARDEAALDAAAAALDLARALRREFPEWTAALPTVALVHDERSIAAAWMRDALLDGPTWPNRLASHQLRHGRWERGARGWLDLLEDAGVQPGSVPLARVDADLSASVALLVLHDTLVLDDADLERLARYAEAGGRVVLSGNLGWIDSRGRARQVDAGQTLLSRAPQRVQRLDLDTPRYAVQRQSRGDFARAARASVREVLRAAGLAPLALRAAGAADDPNPGLFLCRTTRRADGTLLGAALLRGDGANTLVSLEFAPEVAARARWRGLPGRAATQDAPWQPLTLGLGDVALFELAAPLQAPAASGG